MNLFAFGLGYCARHFIARSGSSFDAIAGTVRASAKAEELASENIETLVFGPEHEDAAIAERVASADVILVSVPPGVSADPVLARFGHRIANLRREQTIVYLSTTGVYGDARGEWVDETTTPAPASERSLARLQVEKSWAAIGKESDKKVYILRLAGIYGPGRNVLLNLKAGTAKRVVKRGQVFNRIHVEDIAQAIDAALTRRASGIFNVADDEPTPPGEPLAFAAQLLGVPPPPEIPYEQAQAAMSPLAKSFWQECRRVNNDKFKRELGVTMQYPTYREGLRALFEQERHKR